MPDWRADRHSIRIALVLSERFGVAPGDTVALEMTLRTEWALIERAIWGLGAASVPADSTDSWRAAEPVVIFSDREIAQPPASVRSTLNLTEDYAEIMDYGGVLDTPERATQFRAKARQTPTEAVASIENGREFTQAEWMHAVERFHERVPPKPGTTYVLGSGIPDRAARIALYAGWGSGVVRSAFGANGGTIPDGFVTLSREGI